MRRRNRTFGFVEYQDSYPAVDPKVYQFAGENNIPFIDQMQPFVNHDPDSDGLWEDPYHPGPFGNRLIADDIVDVLKQQQVIQHDQ